MIVDDIILATNTAVGKRCLPVREFLADNKVELVGARRFLRILEDAGFKFSGAGTTNKE